MSKVAANELGLFPVEMVEEFIALTEADEAEDRLFATVRNLMSGQEVIIDADKLGTCCDPSTERYWSM